MMIFLCRSTNTVAGDDVVNRVLYVVPAWARANGVEAARLELDRRVYVVRA